MIIILFTDGLKRGCLHKHMLNKYKANASVNVAIMSRVWYTHIIAYPPIVSQTFHKLFALRLADGNDLA